MNRDEKLAQRYLNTGPFGQASADHLQDRFRRVFGWIAHVE